MDVSKTSLKILILSEATHRPEKIYLHKEFSLAKGFIRLGHEVRHLCYREMLSELSPFKSRSLSSYLYKRKVDKIIYRYAEQYKPDVVFIGFAKYLDKSTLQRLREAAPAAVFVGMDGDLWPARNPGRIETACALDIVMATNNGSSLDEYRKAGVHKLVFMPNPCDPDVEYRYTVDDSRKCDILWTGKVSHKGGVNSGDNVRRDVLRLLVKDSRARLHGCFGRPEVEGIEYLYAISGAKIGISINADNSIPYYHSDRFTHYAACGTMVLAKYVPETEHLMEDKKHVCYFNTPEECLDLADWYLTHESERQKIADRGMEHCHTCFNSVKIAGYILDIINTGGYRSPWGNFP